MSLLSRHSSKDEQESWISISDLMSVLMMVFLLISVAHIQSVSERFTGESQGKGAKVQEDRRETAEPVSAWFKHQEEIYKALMREFGSDLEEWDAEIDPETITVRFKSPRVLFSKGSAELTQTFKYRLVYFWPRYTDILHREEWRDDIEEIRIEGHTSSEWEGVDNKLDAYFRNMELSQDRTHKVMEFLLKIQGMEVREEWLLKRVTANGLSSSKKIIDEAGQENKKDSRRVEFRVRPKTVSIISKIQKRFAQ